MQAVSLGSRQRKVMEKRKGDSHALWVSVQDSNGGLQGTMEAKERKQDSPECGASMLRFGRCSQRLEREKGKS